MQHIDTILIVMVAIFGLSVLLHISVLLGLAIGANRALKNAKQYADEMNTKVQPLLLLSHEVLVQTKDLISKLEPRLEAAAADLADITRTAREESARLKASADEITDRIRRQAAHVEGITNNALNGVDKVGHFISETVNTPVRQVSGVVAAVRAILDTLRRPAPPRRPRPAGDREEAMRPDHQQYV